MKRTQKGQQVFIYAAKIPQELSEEFLFAAEELGGQVRFSPVGCRIGQLGIYVEFLSFSQKQFFAALIEGANVLEVWAS